MPPFVFILLLLGILFLGGYVLWQDNKTKLVDQQLAVMLPTVSASESVPLRRVSARRPQEQGTRYYLRRLLNYEASAPNKVMFFGLGALAAFAAVIINRLILPDWLWLGPIDGLIVAGFTVRGLFGSQQRRYSDKLLRQLPDTLVLVISAVRAGLPVAEAFRAVNHDMPSPTREQFTLVTEALALGRSTADALFDVYNRTDVSEYAMFATTLAVQGKAGGRLAETLQTLADVVRQRVAMAGRANALAGEAKLSSRVLAVLPFVGAIMMYFLQRDSMDILLFDPRGRLMLGAGLVSLAIGMLTMNRMIKKGTAV